MKKFVLLFTGMLMIMSVFAQTNFQELTLEKALEKAKGENKKVFVDCYTSWCGPCKMMAEKVLPLKEVGEYMNERFVCIKVDMEKGEGPDLARKYKVSAYPTFLVLQADGNLMQRVVGGTLDGKEFIQKVDAAFDENSAANLETEYAAGIDGFFVEIHESFDYG
ncbi:MAG: thioredoxin family protein [Butyricimonas faecalis]